MSGKYNASHVFQSILCVSSFTKPCKGIASIEAGLCFVD